MKRILGLVFGALLFLSVSNVEACTTCTICQLGQLGKGCQPGQDEKWTFEYYFEQNNWNVMDAHDAHELHHDGHHVHDKTTEDFHHFKVAYRPTDAFNVSFDFPYVIRRSLEVDNHSILGKKQTSQGPGDAHVTGDYRFWQKDGQSLGLVGGVKLPTGSTREKNSEGDLFEPELQPGSGSFDYILGGVYQVQIDQISLSANTSYVFINKGEQEFKAGDVFTMSLYGEYLINPRSAYAKTHVGLDAVYQNEQKDVSDDARIADSGGATLLMGPVLKLEANDHVSLTTSVLFPAYQNLGGVHQELDYQWTLGSQVRW